MDLLATALPRCALTDLTLDGNYLGCELTLILLNALKARASLTSVRIADCHITDGGSPDAMQAIDTIGAMLKANRFRVLGLDGNRLGGAGVGRLADALQAFKGGGLQLTDLHVDREGNELEAEAEALLTSVAGAHADVCLHLARSEPGHEKQQQKADLKIRDFIKRNPLQATDSPLGPIAAPDAALAVLTPEDGSPESRRKGRSALPTPRRPSPDKKPLTSSPRSAR